MEWLNNYIEQMGVVDIICISLITIGTIAFITLLFLANKRERCDEQSPVEEKVEKLEDKKQENKTPKKYSKFKNEPYSIVCLYITLEEMIKAIKKNTGVKSFCYRMLNSLENLHDIVSQGIEGKLVNNKCHLRGLAAYNKVKEITAIFFEDLESRKSYEDCYNEKLVRFNLCLAICVLVEFEMLNPNLLMSGELKTRFSKQEIKPVTESDIKDVLNVMYRYRTEEEVEAEYGGILITNFISSRTSVLEKIVHYIFDDRFSNFTLGWDMDWYHDETGFITGALTKGYYTSRDKNGKVITVENCGYTTLKRREYIINSVYSKLRFNKPSGVKDFIPEIGSVTAIQSEARPHSEVLIF